MQQLPLLLEHRRLLGREDFLVSPCNIEAVEWIDAYPDWSGNFAVVVLGESRREKPIFLGFSVRKQGQRFMMHWKLGMNCFPILYRLVGHW